MTVRYCVYYGPQTTCEPRLLLTCTSLYGPAFAGTIDDYRNTAGHPCPLNGNADIGLSAWRNEEGDIDAVLRAVGREPEDNCAYAGDPAEERMTLPGGCCTSTIRVHYPVNDLGVIFRVQSDWELPEEL
jgi:hypothetical protein